MPHMTEPPAEIRRLLLDKKLADLMALADEFGVQLPGITKAHAALDRSREFTHTRFDRKAAIAGAAADLADAKIDTEAARDKATLIDAVGGDAFVAVRRQAAARLRERAYEALKDPNETILDSLKVAAGTVLEDIRKLRRIIPDDVADASAASAAGEKVAAAWSKYEGLLQRWDAVHTLAGRMRSLGLLPVADNADRVRREGYAWRDHLGREDFRQEHRKSRGLLDAALDAFGPGLYSAAETEANINDALVREREERREAAAEAARSSRNPLVRAGAGVSV